MSNETYRQFDPWRPSPVKEISRRQIVETHYFNVDHVSYESNQIGSFERYFVQENNESPHPKWMGAFVICYVAIVW